MQTQAKVENPESITVELTVTMTVFELESIAEDIANKKRRVPISSFGRQLHNVSKLVREQFFSDEVENQAGR